ncbi:hypothetical protein B0H66DRAFT_527312 [Apodospora peruviana]|uniref:Threonine/serine exporter-like N-terminal domain-containing protein n=1 Tax=Apodospora peruviana TaxID=516989 RepID=A0AAE0MF47_9PEZI|nr:hypothetical protein B0H66DRAFT_527312 [Apodospora peruviana]
MASPQAPDNLEGQGGSGQWPGKLGQESHTSQQYDESTSTQLPSKGKEKEKKKVGFVGDNRPPQASTSGNATGPPSVVVTPSESQHIGQDYFSSPGSDLDAPSPLHFGGPGNRDSFNKDELAAALAMILKPEHHGGPAPSKPRPVLRKQRNPDDSPVEMTTAPHRSEVEARHRADRLAQAVGASSVPDSRRTSLDPNDPGMLSPFDDAYEARETAERNQENSDRRGDYSGLRARKGAQQLASELVRSHTRRITPLTNPFTDSPRSGTATPIPDDVEYVPRPDKYKGGVLGSLLKLYNTESKKGLGGMDGDSSFQTTPSRTPDRTPSGTPPPSRPGTPSGTPRRGRPRPGFLGGSRPQSTSTLAGLMESSFMFASTAPKNITEAVSEKVKHEQEKSRPKKRSRSRQKLEEFRITVHIAEIINRHKYLVKLCRALMMYGAPTHRLETYMRMSARVLGIEGQFMYLPGTMIISFDDSNTHTTEMKIVQSPQGVDLGRLRDVHEIYKEVVHDLIGVEEATTRLNEVINRKPKFPTWLRVLLYGIASAFVAPFGFEGRYIDMPICVILGCLVGYLQLFLAPSNELYANVFEITAAVITSFLARVFGSLHSGELFCFSALAQASIALILPGYMVLSASLELQSHQMISGSVRMVYALIYSLFLGYGITIGSVIYGYLDENAVSAVHCSVGDTWYTQKPGQNFYLLFVFPFTLCLCAINQAKWKQTPVMVVISLAGYCVNNFSSRSFQGNPTLSSSLGALCVGVLANLYARLGRYVENYFRDIWDNHIKHRVQRISRKSGRGRRPYYFNDSAAAAGAESSGDEANAKEDDVELGLNSNTTRAQSVVKKVRRIGFGLAAAAMLPGIFVQVPSGLAVGGSLLSGVTSADQITRNETMLTNGTTMNNGMELANTSTSTTTDLGGTAFNVLFSVIQVAISISVGLSLSALIVYPYGKKRSGLFSF